jgi:GT2 family glycosyltransferase
VVAPTLLTFDLVVATVGRTDELGRFLASLEEQGYGRFRVLVVDQNEDGRLDAVLGSHSQLDLVHLRSEPGLSRARNRALGHLRADVVAFPDDDCVYPRDLLERIADRLSRDPRLDGLSGRAVDRDGRSSKSWEPDAVELTDTNLWNRAISYTIFLRRGLVEQVGAFDEQLGLGSGNPWSSGEEIDYLVRAVRNGARIAYDPDLTVVHETRRHTPASGYRDGASLGYVLRKNRYPLREKALRLVRPAGGIALSLARLDREQASFHLATLRGRLYGLRRAR